MTDLIGHLYTGNQSVLK